MKPLTSSPANSIALTLSRFIADAHASMHDREDV